MDAFAGEQRSFIHRVLRWIALLAITFSLLNVVTYVVIIASQGFMFARSWYAGELGYVYYAAAFCTTLIQIAGGWGLLRWKAWGRTLLIIWSVFSMLVGLLTVAVSMSYYYRQVSSTTQPGYQVNLGLVTWNSFYYWAHNCGLPVICLAVLLQPDVKRLWSGVRATGFDVIPFASVNGDEARSDERVEADQ